VGERSAVRIVGLDYADEKLFSIQLQPLRRLHTKIKWNVEKKFD